MIRIEQSDPNSENARTASGETVQDAAAELLSEDVTSERVEWLSGALITSPSGVVWAPGATYRMTTREGDLTPGGESKT